MTTHLPTGIKDLDDCTIGGFLIGHMTLVQGENPGRFIRRIINNVTYRGFNVTLIGHPSKGAEPWFPKPDGDINPTSFEFAGLSTTRTAFSEFYRRATIDNHWDLVIIDCKGLVTEPGGYAGAFWARVVPHLHNKLGQSHAIFVNPPGNGPKYFSTLTLDIEGNSLTVAKNRYGKQRSTFEWVQ